jgi:pyridinium-3,5-biscarboxylic acid mononucleotide sulfurtransferase
VQRRVQNLRSELSTNFACFIVLYRALSCPFVVSSLSLSTTAAPNGIFPPVNKLDDLRELLRSYGSCLVAYSGGVDSVFLAHVAHEVLRDRALAAIADSPSLPRRELADAIEIAKQFEIPLRIVHTREFDNDSYLANPGNRCYFCKHELFTELAPLARSEGFTVIAYGENASDVGDHRPGAIAAAEFQVRAPLKEAGLTKTEIREFSAALGLPTADKPQLACLSSRIPYGEPVTVEKLGMIENAEYLLRDQGFYDVRVRHHELKTGHLARIEIGPDEIARMFQGNSYSELAAAIKKLGYAHVTLDLEGYRRGSLNAAPISFRPQPK